ncbi:uncharacterized protein B4U80_10075 [Leptotrombidium deliense]|uniref:Uncharacterized protein n=1 Tax=Leptotrombidium deliense TaxID=299467 RepID=A0A443SUL3_9ACAR|nr:uncharacterized protein B4U80_10075 [Leptotrombidium deliense]
MVVMSTLTKTHQIDARLKLYYVEVPRHVTFTDSGFENPFRPGGELSREAETIVNLIKEGKPITPTTPDKDICDSIPNGDQLIEHPICETPVTALNASNNSRTERTPNSHGVNNGTPKGRGVVDVQRGLAPQTDAPQTAEPVVLKKKPKCKCCVIQ